MFPWSGETEFSVITFLVDTQEPAAAAAFNYFFTLVFLCGLFAWGIGCLATMINRS